MRKIENRIKNKENRTENRGRVGNVISTKYFYVLFSMFFSFAANAQCAMCRAALAGDSNTKKAEAVNDGIVYLMVIPYLLVGIIGVLIYRMYQSKKKKAV
jgi:amino acid permease